MMQANNQILGSPSSRVNLTAKVRLSHCACFTPSPHYLGDRSCAPGNQDKLHNAICGAKADLAVGVDRLLSIDRHVQPVLLHLATGQNELGHLQDYTRDCRYRILGYADKTVYVICTTWKALSMDEEGVQAGTRSSKERVKLTDRVDTG